MDVDLRRGKLGDPAQCEQALLGFGSGEGGWVGGDQGAKGADPGAARKPGKQGDQLVATCEASGFRFGEGALQVARRDHRGEVEDGAGWGGDWDPAEAADVALVERRHAMDSYPTPRSGIAACDGDFDIGGRGWVKPPQGGGAAVAQRSTWSAGEDGAKFASTLGRVGVAQEVDAAIEAVQSSRLEPVVDRVACETCFDNLRAGDDPSLPRG